MEKDATIDNLKNKKVLFLFAKNDPFDITNNTIMGTATYLCDNFNIDKIDDDLLDKINHFTCYFFDERKKMYLDDYIENCDYIIFYDDDDTNNYLNKLKKKYQEEKKEETIDKINELANNKCIINLADKITDKIKYKRWKPTINKKYPSLSTTLNNYLNFNLNINNTNADIILLYIIKMLYEIYKKKELKCLYCNDTSNILDYDFLCKKCHETELLEYELNANEKLNILTFNMFFGEKQSQIENILKSNYDILFLQECSKEIIKKMKNFDGYIVKSPIHYKEENYYTYIGINNKNNIKILEKYEDNGIIIIIIIIKNIKLCISSIHLIPRQYNHKERKIQINKITEFILKHKIENIPIIICGDTNMYDYENIDKFYIDIGKNIHNLEYSKTYPNLICKDQKFNNKKCQTIPQRFDRIIIKNCFYNNLKTHEDELSDHYMVTSNIFLRK